MLSAAHLVNHQPPAVAHLRSKQPQAEASVPSGHPSLSSQSEAEMAAVSVRQSLRQAECRTRRSVVARKPSWPFRPAPPGAPPAALPLPCCQSASCRRACLCRSERGELARTIPSSPPWRPPRAGTSAQRGVETQRRIGSGPCTCKRVRAFAETRELRRHMGTTALHAFNIYVRRTSDPGSGVGAVAAGRPVATCCASPAALDRCASLIATIRAAQMVQAPLLEQDAGLYASMAGTVWTTGGAAATGLRPSWSAGGERGGGGLLTRLYMTPQAGPNSHDGGVHFGLFCSRQLGMCVSSGYSFRASGEKRLSRLAVWCRLASGHLNSSAGRIMTVWIQVWDLQQGEEMRWPREMRSSAGTSRRAQRTAGYGHMEHRSRHTPPSPPHPHTHTHTHTLKEIPPWLRTAATAAAAVSCETLSRLPLEGQVGPPQFPSAAYVAKILRAELARHVQQPCTECAGGIPALEASVWRASGVMQWRLSLTRRWYLRIPEGLISPRSSSIKPRLPQTELRQKAARNSAGLGPVGKEPETRFGSTVHQTSRLGRGRGQAVVPAGDGGRTDSSQYLSHRDGAPHEAHLQTDAALAWWTTPAGGNEARWSDAWPPIRTITDRCTTECWPSRAAQEHVALLCMVVWVSLSHVNYAHQRARRRHGHAEDRHVAEPTRKGVPIITQDATGMRK